MVSTPAITLPFVRIPVDHPMSPRIGQPCRVGTAVGIRVYDPLYERLLLESQQENRSHYPSEANHVYGNREIPVSFHHTTWKIRVRNLSSQPAIPGEIVQYFDHLGEGAPGSITNCAVNPGSEDHSADATVGLLLEHIEPRDIADVTVLMQYVQRDWHWLSCPMVERTPGLRNGEWVFRGTRLPVTMLFECLQDGGTIDDFLADHDSVSREQLIAVLQHTISDLAKYSDPAQTSPYPTPEAAPNA